MPTPVSTLAEADAEHPAYRALAHAVTLAGPLLPTVSIVEQTMALARHSLALALAGAALIVGGLLAERLWLSAAHEAAAERHGLAQRLAGDVRLADQRLTTAAQLAVATGARRWVDDYDTHLPELDVALARAKALAPPAAAGRFEQQTRVANEELTSMRESAFEAVTVGAVDVARTIFDGERYRHNSRMLAAATAEFTAATVQATQAELAALKQRALLVGTLVLLGALLLGAALWRRLTHRLARSRTFFLDAEDRMQRLASSDLLTGLANRAALHDAMATAMARTARDGHRLAVLMIDLDRFKPVNDRHGHTVGDLVLKVADRAALEQAMREGVARGEFVPCYQPIVDLATRAVQSLGLLCRWHQPQRGLLAPAQFIALAEDTGLIGPMLLSVLRQACVDLQRLPAHWRLSINIAPQQILDATLVPQPLAVLREYAVP